ncbi:hypothetical protein MN032_03125 [Agromyces atrinae]|uniref:hypothetical protein n=1 Tax=Agromyces atrinae TaxID=592376 RepID=UPI001F57323B|nr:hypothetical protein [Agromyces atrinae]MCI2956675.1 hypothetical protein [Agromyces atrinae]
MHSRQRQSARAGEAPAGGGASLAGTGFELPLGALGFAFLALVGGAFLIRKRRVDRA